VRSEPDRESLAAVGFLQQSTATALTDMPEMKQIDVSLERVNDAFHFRSINVHGHTVEIDDSGAYDTGNGSGTGPMELLLSAIGGCSAFDVVGILEKARQTIEGMHIDVRGLKPAGTAPSLYRNILLTYRLDGDLDEKKVRRAIELSLEKYCSVSRTLSPTAEIAYAFTINGDAYDGRTISEPSQPQITEE
jgi:putative redox protein